MFRMREQSENSCSFVMEIRMKYVVIGGVVLWVLFSVERLLIVDSFITGEQILGIIKIIREDSKVPCENKVNYRYI